MNPDISMCRNDKCPKKDVDCDVCKDTGKIGKDMDEPCPACSPTQSADMDELFDKLERKIDVNKLASAVWASMKPRIEDAPNWENIDKENREVFIEQAEHLAKTQNEWLRVEKEGK